MQTTAAYKCSRCQGKGRLSAFSHVVSGVCFKCGGIGTQATKPTVALPLFAVIFVSRATGAAERIYNLRARTSAVAMRVAAARYEQASSAFRDEYSMQGAVAVRADELDDVEAVVADSLPDAAITAHYTDRANSGFAALAR